MSDAGSRSPVYPGLSDAEVAQWRMEREDLHQASCEYLSRCYPDALQAYPQGTLEGCLSVPTCQLPLTGHQVVPACLEFLQDDPCSVPLAPAPFGQTAPQGRLPVLVPAGSPCDYYADLYAGKPDLGEPCIADEFPCQQGLYCELDLPPKQVGITFCGRCAAPRQLGDSCAQGERCVRGTRCLNDVCGPGIEDGQVCTQSSECVHGRCLDGVCESTPRQIVAIDGGAFGEGCAPDGSPCNSDWTLACVGGQCVHRPDDGEACDSQDDCRIGFGCDAGRCVAVPCEASDSEFCSVSTRCPADYACLDNHCERIIGVPCSQNLDCLAGLLCSDGICTIPERADPLPSADPVRPNGSPCRSSSECQSLNCFIDIVPDCEVDRDGYVCFGTQCDGDCGVCQEYLGVAACP